jgi:hypothetical protein
LLGNHASKEVHHYPLLGPAARGYVTSKLLNGIAAGADVITDLYVTSDPRLTTGFMWSTNVGAGL